ncbi:uncharacterized protein A4U43_C02F17660 [Asparagus officinalis]|uniref:NAC domain-containing protein n=1 Tax=Asparagus officinalis TaxID=4686 RepID=A0A5P1FJU1_ASPOF|nr:uncharacterized protein A4U43_C02F17660 [Asparagus officinalis]
MGRSRDAEAELNLPPGFRFHPTDEELVVHYLCRKATYQRLPAPIIAERRHCSDKGNGTSSPRGTGNTLTGPAPTGQPAKDTGRQPAPDKPVSPAGSKKPLGIKKALVFYSGKAPRGIKTDWIMHEYRLADTNRSANKKGSLRLDDWVLCRLYNKKNNWEKMQKQKEQSSSFGETIDSLEAADDAISESIRSDIENDVFPPQVYQSQMSQVNEQPQMKKEDSDWFMDLNLDDLQSSFGAFGSSATGFDISNQDYFMQVLGSPMMKTSQNNLPPF